MQSLTVLLQFISFFFCLSSSQSSFNQDTYLEVYPDPTDPEVLKGRTPLYFALIQTLGGLSSQFDGSGSIAGVKVALDSINNDTTLLPGYTLHYTLTDSKCTNKSESLPSFFNQIFNRPTKLAIMGSGCSVSTEASAAISHYYNISQISCISSSAALRNRGDFPFHFQLLLSEDTLAFAYYSVIREFGWRRVSLIVQKENLFTVTMNRLKALLDSANIAYSERTFTDTSDLNFELFDTQYARIFLLSMYARHARSLLCVAYKNNITLPRYLLMTIGWYTRFWWRENQEGLSCTADQRESVLKSSLAVLQFSFLNESSEADRNRETTSGITGGQFLDKQTKFLGTPPLNATKSRYSQYCFDAVWTLAYSLNETLNSIRDMRLNTELAQAYNTGPYPFRLENFTYESDGLLQVMFEHLSSTSFNGITGHVNFGGQGTRDVTNLELHIFQFRSVINGTDNRKYLEMVDIGLVDTDGEERHNFSYANNESLQTVWQGLVPYDGIPRNVTVSVQLAVTVIFVTLSVAGMAFATVCLIFNFIYRNSKLVRLASSKLNYIIGIGAIILYTNIFFVTIPTTDQTVASVFCNITPWLTAIGYSFCYGTILAKMVRVYYIFDNPSLKKKGIHDWTLLLGVGLLVVADLTILVTYTAVVGTRGNLTAILIPHGEKPVSREGEQEIITNFRIYVCESMANDIFRGVLYGYKMLLQIFALLLAFSIRKVKVKGLNDSKYIAAAVYITSISLAVIIVATYTLRTHINGFATLYSIGFCFGTTIILILVFVPLMVGVYKDPKGKKIFTKSTSPSVDDLDSIAVIPVREVEHLRKEIRDLTTELDVIKRRTATPEIKPKTPKRGSSVTMENSHTVCVSYVSCEESDCEKSLSGSYHADTEKMNGTVGISFNE